MWQEIQEICAINAPKQLVKKTAVIVIISMWSLVLYQTAEPRRPCDIKFILKPPYWPFGTLPFGLFWSNLDTMDPETYPRTCCGHFWNMSLFDNSRAIWVLFRKWVVSENQSVLDEGAIIWPLIGLVLEGHVPRLNHGPICFPIILIIEVFHQESVHRCSLGCSANLF